MVRVFDFHILRIIKNMKNKIKKYYIKTEDCGICLERCNVINSGLYIGSIGCNYICKYLKFKGHDKNGS